VIEWLEMLVDYESDPPPFGLNEALNQWEDWNPPGSTYPEPVYTSSEQQKLTLVTQAWEGLCEATPSNINSDQPEMQKPEWNRLVAASHAALVELLKRGKFEA
jgi:hypothetical protein